MFVIRARTSTGEDRKLSEHELLSVAQALATTAWNSLKAVGYINCDNDKEPYYVHSVLAKDNHIVRIVIIDETSW